MFSFLRSIKSQLFFMLLVFGMVIIATLTITLTISLSSMKQENRDILQSSLSRRYDTMVRAQVQQAIAALQLEWDRRTSDEQGTEACKSLLRALRYLDDRSGYFWATDDQGVFRVHSSKPDLEGQMAIESMDTHGIKYIKEIIRAGLQQGGGFTNYWFTKDTDKLHEYPKRSYSIAFKPLGWVIGTGNYIDDIDKEIAVYAAKFDINFNRLQIDTVSRLAIILLVLFFTLFLFNLRILDLIRKLNEALFEITQVGTDLKIKLPLKGPTELVTAAKSFNEFTESIHDILNTFSRDANAVGHANDEIYAKLGTLSDNLTQLSTQMRNLFKATLSAPASIIQGVESMRNMARMADQAVELTASISTDARKRNEAYANTTGELIRFKLDN